jgi:GR25 family glycosyltransferase involved in LPS biosynthesis
MHIEHTFVINLKNRPDRWNTVQNSFKDTKLKLIRWDAVYGKNMSDAEIKDITTPFCNIFCSHGMIGCWLSHYKIWEHIVENNLDNVLILEDDTSPVAQFDKKLNDLMKIVPENYDLLYIGCFGTCDTLGNNVSRMLCNGVNKEAVVDGKKIDGLMIPAVPLGTHAYMVSNKGATKLINDVDLKKVRYHIDYTLSKFVYNANKGFIMFAPLKPLIFQECDISTSDLSSNDHPIINYLFSHVKLSDNYNLDFITNVQILNIRKLSISITFFTIILPLLSFLIGMFGSRTVIQWYICVLFSMYIIDFAIITGYNKKYNISNMSCEMLLVIMFLYSGIRFNTKLNSE